jgi:hypothetical protein
LISDECEIFLYVTGQYSAIAHLHILQFTVTHALGFSVFISSILASVYNTLSLQITHEVFVTPPNSFLTIILQLSIPKTRLSSIHLLPSSYPGRLASRNATLHSTASNGLFFITTLHVYNVENSASLFLTSRVYCAVA